MSIYCEDVNLKLDSRLEEIIEAFAKEEDIVTYKCDVQRINTYRVNFLGELFEIDIKGETVDGVKEINLIVKSKLTDESNLKLLSINDVYSRELYAYKELSDIYKQLQEEANVPNQYRYNFGKYFDVRNNDVIVLDNLRKQGYENHSRFEIVSTDIAQKCIKQLAKFHSLSFVLEKERLDYFNCNIKLLKYPLIFNEDYVKYLNKMFEICLNHLDGEYKTKLESFRDICEKFYHHVNNASVIRCLCHGDYRAMSIMKKSLNSEPLEIIAQDYQFLFYGSPVIDILCFIFSSTDREFRRLHLENIINLYRDTMKEFLDFFEMDINLYYPRTEFDKSYEESFEFSLLIFIWYLPIYLGVEYSETSDDTHFPVNERIKLRLEDIIDDLTEWGVFDKPVVE